MAAPLRQPPVVETFGGGGFRIAGARWEGSVLILNDEVRAWPVTGIADLTADRLRDVLSAPSEIVELVLVGTGSAVSLAPRALRETVKAAGLGLEVMSTPEACRMYNFLAGEGRRVAAALIAV
ncbi:MAG: Mth938-like domain-containing protein [Caulobacteraceae bacterium]